MSLPINKYKSDTEMDAQDIYRINQLEVIFLARDSWNSIRAQKIPNCFRHVGISSALEKAPNPIQASNFLNLKSGLRFQTSNLSLKSFTNAGAFPGASKQVKHISIPQLLQLLKPELKTLPSGAKGAMIFAVKIFQTTEARQALNLVVIEYIKEIHNPGVPWLFQEDR